MIFFESDFLLWYVNISFFDIFGMIFILGGVGDVGEGVVVVVLL